MSSGVAVDAACNEMWKVFHGATVKTRRVITFRLNDTFDAIIPESYEWQLPLTHINDIDGVEETKETVAKLKDLIVREINDEKTIQEPRWIIMYLDYNMAEDKRLTGKEIMLKWCPDGAADKSKITFASSSKGLTDALDGFKALVVQADKLAEIDDLLPRFRKGLL
ncbi:hypothetical protein ACHWQZ_G006652 [Mnemiopsis leidyi]